jgi:ABC-type transport system involved in multi-copper enzyme maturation permease subunit
MTAELRGAMRDGGGGEPGRGAIPGALSTVWTLMVITFIRLGRGKALWAGGGIAALKVALAVVLRNRASSVSVTEMFDTSLLLLAILPPMFVGGSIGQDIEDRSSTYLWSRPIGRWAVLVGKLCALTPIVIALVVGGWYLSMQIWRAAPPTLASCLALAAGCVATSLIAAGIATVLPKHGMSLTIGYMLVDIFIGAMPFSLRELSIAHQTGVLSHLGGDTATAAPLIAMAVVSGLWAVVGFLRIRVLET